MSTNDNLSLMLAKRRVAEFADEALMQRHDEAMQCRNCEDWLRKGIDAYRWLQRAEETMREADSAGILEFDAESRIVLETLYQRWLDRTDVIEPQVLELLAKGYSLDHVDRFREACEEVQDLLDRRDWQQRATASQAVCDSEEGW